jgi:hypothetical protein
MHTLVARSTAELRKMLITSAPGDTIELAPGEYRGAFLIDKPLTIRGENRRTVLWRRGGPVLYVRSYGVRLERVQLERTIDAGPLIIYDRECDPSGKEGMEAETLISLGELTPGANLTLPIEIETRGRADISVAGMYGAQITPAVLESAGKHTVTLSLDGTSILKGEVLLGEVTLNEEDSTRYLWISGVVLDAPPPEQGYALATKKIRLHPSPNGLIIDGNLLTALEGGVYKGRYAVIQRETSGNLYMYVPGEPPLPVQINDRSIPRNTRQLLREGDVIKIGKVIINVQPVEPPTITLEPESITFTEFGTQFPDPIAFTLRPRAGWVGQLLATVPWLTITPPGTIRLGGTKPQTWQIGLTEDALQLPNGVYDVIGGLLLTSSDHLISLDVHLEVKRPNIALTIQPIEAGSVEASWPSEHEIEFQIANFGRGAWSGTLRSTVPWLEVITPMPIGGETWSATLVQLKVVAPTTPDVKPGKLDVPDALLLTYDDGSTQAIPASLNVEPSQGHLIIDAEQVSFEDVERGAPNLPATTLMLRNVGGAAMTATVEAINGWVEVDPATFTIEAGEAIELTIDLLNVPDNQPLNTPLMIDELRFSTGDVVSVALTLIELPPYLVAPQVNFPPFVHGDMPPDATLSIQNMGPAIWRGAVTTKVDWLTVPERLLICEPHDHVEIPISLNPQKIDTLQHGLHRTADALAISGARSEVLVAVQTDIRDISTELVLETPIINFGLVNGGAVELPHEVVRLLNASPQVWKGTLEVNVPWLSLEGDNRVSEIEVPKNSIAEFRVLLNDTARHLPPGTVSDDAVTIIGGEAKARQRLSVRVLLSMVEWGPVLEVKPPSLTINGESPQKLTIRNVGNRSWKLQISAVPWLAAEPTELVIEPQHDSVVEVRKQPAANVADHIDDPRAVVVIGQGREVEVRVSV